MRKTALTTAILTVALAGVAQADGGSTTTTSPTATAQQLCRAERGTSTVTRDAFAAKYGTNKNKSNAFGKCVSKTAAAQRAQPASAPSDAIEISAAKACSTERGTTTETLSAFAQKYGANKSKSNAWGKCVSTTAKAKAKGKHKS